MIDLSNYDEIIIWGASFPPSEIIGDATSHGRAIESLFKLLESNGYWQKVIGIVDSNSDLQGKVRLGKIVYAPSYLKNHPKALIIINTISIKAIQDAMNNMGILNDYLVIPYYFYHGTLENKYDNEVAYKDIIKNECKIRDLYNIGDYQTKRYLDIICDIRKRKNDDLYKSDFYEGTVEPVEYFCDPQIAAKGNVTYIDVGAYNGDSIEPILCFYGDRVKKILAFEPDENSLKKLKDYINKRSISDIVDIYPYALGSENQIVHLTRSGLVSIVSDEGECTLEQRIFDDLNDVEIIGEVMVKMDIEGYELDALKGMKKLILEKQPYLAICIYHKEQDLYEIAEYLKSINPSYRLYIRGGWHLECWAVPERHFN